MAGGGKDVEVVIPGVEAESENDKLNCSSNGFGGPQFCKTDAQFDSFGIG